MTFGVGEEKGRVHTKRVGIKLYDCEHGIQRSQCKQGCGGGSEDGHKRQEQERGKEKAR